VHVAEEDTGAGAVYRPDDENIPLSRRPRDWLELDEDGSAKLYIPGPDDRPVARRVTWIDRSSDAGGRQAGEDADVTVLEKSPSRLLVKLRTSIGR
jgi:hypothetical protein